MTATRRSRSDIASILSSLALAFISFVVMGGIVTAWYPAGPITRLSIRVVNSPRVNGDVHVFVDYCKASDMPPAEVRWALLDGVAVMLPPHVVTLPKGCHQTTVGIPLNRSVAPGVYQLQVTGIYHVWPWREVVYTRTSPPFRLLPEDGAP